MNWLKKYDEDEEESRRHEWPYTFEGESYNLNHFKTLTHLQEKTGNDDIGNFTLQCFKSILTRGWLSRRVYSNLFDLIGNIAQQNSSRFYHHLRRFAGFSSVSPTAVLRRHYQFDIEDCTNVKHLGRIMFGGNELILCHDENGARVGQRQVLSDQKIIWCCKTSASEFIIVHTSGSTRHVRDASRKSRGAQYDKSKVKITLFKCSTGEFLTKGLKVSEDIITCLQCNNESMSAFSDISENKIVFVTNLFPLQTVTYTKTNVDVHNLITFEEKKSRQEFELFRELSDFQDPKPKITPQCSAININGKVILCGKMIFTNSPGRNKYGCPPNEFIKTFGYRPVNLFESNLTSSLLFFYRLENNHEGYQITEISSGFHPSLPDESVDVNQEYFLYKYSYDQTVVGLDAKEGTALLFWNGTSNLKPNENFDTHMQVLDTRVILSIISSKRQSIRNFSVHPNYLRALKPDTLKHTRLNGSGKTFYMVGASRTKGRIDGREVASKAFNPTIQYVAHRRELFVLMRQAQDIVDWSGSNELVVELGSLDPTEPKYTANETNVVEQGANTAGIMDARLIEVDGSSQNTFYVIYYTNLSEEETRKEIQDRETRKLPPLKKSRGESVEEHGTRSRMFIQKGNFVESRNIAHRDGFVVPTPFCQFRSRSLTEKNWSVFVTGKGDLNFNKDNRGRVKFSLSIDPLIVYGANGGFDDECPREKSVNLPSEFSHMLHKSRLDLRGGSCGIPYGENGDFLFVGHGVQTPDTQISRMSCFPDYLVGEWHSSKAKTNEDDRRARYNQMYWVFFYVIGKDTRGRWRVTKISMCSQLHGRQFPYPKIAFASGLTRVKNGYNVAFGEWDLSSVFTFLSNDFMEAILRPAEELDTQSYVTDSALFESLLLDYADDMQPTIEPDSEDEEEGKDGDEEKEEEDRKHKGERKGKGQQSRNKRKRVPEQSSQDRVPREPFKEFIHVPDSDEEREEKKKGK